MRGRSDPCTAALKIGIETVDVVDIQIDVSLKRRSLSLRRFPATNLEVDLNPRPGHDGVDAARFIGGWLKHAIDRIKAKTKYIAIVLGGLTYLTDPENGRCLPCLALQRTPPHMRLTVSA